MAPVRGSVRTRWKRGALAYWDTDRLSRSIGQATCLACPRRQRCGTLILPSAERRETEES